MKIIGICYRPLAAISFSLIVAFGSPVSSQATTTVLNFYTGSYDGSVRVTNLGTWDGAHDASFGQVLPGVSSYIRAGSFMSTGNEFFISRGFLPFDTSSLPDSAIIASSTLYVYPVQRFLSENDSQSYLQPVGPATPGTSTSLVSGDFDQAGSVNNPTVWSDTKSHYTDSWVATGYVPFVLNEDGRDGISKNGYTNIAVRLGHDIEDVSPDTGVAGVGNQWEFYSGSASSGLRPYLEVVYVEAN